MHRIETVTVQDGPMEVFIFEPEGAGPHPGIVLCQHIPIGHTGVENDTFTLTTAECLAEVAEDHRGKQKQAAGENDRHHAGLVYPEG